MKMGSRAAATPFYCVLALMVGGAPATAVELDRERTAPSLVARQPVELRFERSATESTILLRGRDARRQLIVTGVDASGMTFDATHAVTYTVEPAGVVAVDPRGLVSPHAGGNVTVTARWQSLAVQQTLQVVDFDANQPVSFPTQIIPLFTKYGCNGGGCHGKASGQNGFKLSLLGFEPLEDFEHLVKESRGRRLFPAAPDRSLLLTKATNESPHGGGKRMESDSHEYRLLRRWIAQGMPYGTGNEPVVQRIEVVPQELLVAPGSQQQLAVLAHYSDGAIEDITRATQFEPNVVEMAEVTPEGLVQLRDSFGDVAIMARYQGQVAVCRMDLPLGAPIDAWPATKNGIDTAVFNKLRRLGIPPSPACDDETFLRRVTLDLTGRLPTLEERDAFLRDLAEDKRDRVIDRLLDSDDYADYFASKWSAILRNRQTKSEYQAGNFAFHQWIRQSLQDNLPYDQFVREILTASGDLLSNPAVAWYREVDDLNQRVEDSAQLFLGQRIQCARCHHHPFEKWSQADYFHYAAYFSLVSTKPGAINDEPAFFVRPGNPTAPHPKTGAALKAKGLDAPDSDIPSGTDPREHLVDWMVAPENPFFAPALVNRYWKHFFGRGLVEPEDDLRVTNPASNQALMDTLATEFTKSRYDLKALVRLICCSSTYQLSAEANPHNLSDRRCYSRFYPKRLTAEVLLDAVDTLTEHRTNFAGLPAATRAVALPHTGFDSYFLTVFGRPESTTACECERLQEANLAQSLHLLNSKEMQTKLTSDQGRAARWANDQATPVEAKIQELYFVALGRAPSPQELEQLRGYLNEKSHSRQAYEDVLWSMINSQEFLFNH